MRVHTRLEYKWVDYGNDDVRLELVHEEGYDYDGPVAECKGDQIAKQMEADQAAFNRQLISIFGQQFGKQSAITDYLTAKMQPIIDKGGEGYSSEALAAMRTSTTDQLSNSYQNAQKALQSQQFTNGSRDLPSGVNDQLNAQLMNAEASDKAAAQNNITLANENLKQTNYWNAINALSGNAAMLNPQSYAQIVPEGSNAVAGLSKAYQDSKKSALMGALGGLAGGIFGAAGQAGGFGKLFCWVAAKVFNEDIETGPRVNLVRNWMLNEFSKHWYGRVINRLYARYGEWISQHRVLVKMLAPLFRLALRKATEGK